MTTGTGVDLLGAAGDSDVGVVRAGVGFEVGLDGNCDALDSVGAEDDTGVVPDPNRGEWLGFGRAVKGDDAEVP